MKSDIIDRINDFGISEYFIDMGLQQDMAEVYSLFDLVLLLSSHEGMPNVVIESMACGVPVFANPVGNVEELFENECGFVNRSAVPEEIAENVNQLLKSSDLREKVSINARNRILKEYSMDNTISQLLKYYHLN